MSFMEQKHGGNHVNLRQERGLCSRKIPAEEAQFRPTLQRALLD